MILKKKKRNLFGIYNCFCIVKVFKYIKARLKNRKFEFFFDTAITKNNTVYIPINFKQRIIKILKNKSLFFRIVDRLICCNKMMLRLYVILLKRFNVYNNFMIGLCKKRKYNWTVFSFGEYRFYRSIHSFNKRVSDHIYSSNMITKINKVVSFKRKVSFLKKHDRWKMFFLFRVNTLKQNRISKVNKGISYLSSMKQFDHLRETNVRPSFDKLVDFKKKIGLIFYWNRFILRNYFFFKKMRQFKFTRFFSKILKSDYFSFIKFFEFSLMNVLLRSRLFFTNDECIFVIKNGLVRVNGVKVVDVFHRLMVGDVVQIPISNKYYTFYKYNLHCKSSLLVGVTNKIWQISRLTGNLYKQVTNHVPNWIRKIIYFYEDVPDYLEVDYVILSLVVLNNKFYFHKYNVYFTKFISFFLLRHYNWNYVV